VPVPSPGNAAESRKRGWIGLLSIQDQDNDPPIWAAMDPDPTEQKEKKLKFQQFVPLPSEHDLYPH
jgi:hypothetical protein